MTETGSGVSRALRAARGDSTPVTDPDNYAVNPRGGGHAPDPEWG